MTVVQTRDTLLSYTILLPATGCRLWSRGKSTEGYGIIYHEGSQYYAHRLMFLFDKGYTPSLPLQVLHRCHNPSCIEPSHLYEGNKQRNLQDAYEAGHRNTTCIYGAITPDIVRGIRSMREEGHTLKQVAIEYGVAPMTVNNIAKRISWSNIED